MNLINVPEPLEPLVLIQTSGSQIQIRQTEPNN